LTDRGGCLGGYFGRWCCCGARTWQWGLKSRWLRGFGGHAWWLGGLGGCVDDAWWQGETMARWN